MACLRDLFRLAVAGLCLWPVALVAQPLPEPAGYISRVSGEALVTSRGITSELLPGQAVIEGMTLHSGPGGGLAVIFEDGTVMSFGPDSELHLERYRFTPANGAFALEARFERGTLSIESGAITRLDPDAINLRTPDARVRVRAGHALLKVSR